MLLCTDDYRCFNSYQPHHISVCSSDSGTLERQTAEAVCKTSTSEVRAGGNELGLRWQIVPANRRISSQTTWFYQLPVHSSSPRSRRLRGLCSLCVSVVGFYFTVIHSGFVPLYSIQFV